jgi:hypothetical protein
MAASGTCALPPPLCAAGAIMVGNAPAAFAAWLAGQRRAAAQVIRAAGITLG